MEIVEEPKMNETIYQHEAVNLVICRLIKERNEAIGILNNYKSHYGEFKNEEGGEGEEFDYMGIYDELSERITGMAQQLTEERKNNKKKKIVGIKTPSKLRDFKVDNRSYPLHSAAKPGVTCIDIHPYFDNMILTGGNDAKVVLFDKQQEKSLFNMEHSHSKKINSVEFYPAEDIFGFISGSADNTASFWI